MATTTRSADRRWIPVQDVLDELEEFETERLAGMLTRWVDEPAFLPVTRGDDEEPVANG
ncbi:MAG: hypothetical protein R3343_02055 [Nitriliruptorales bacterium]|nr:hypothetical protein [Nitriliruptorales bacterium]